MKEEIKAFLNNETYILAYRSNYDSAREVNQMLIDYVKDLQFRLKGIQEERDYLFNKLSIENKSLQSQIKEKEEENEQLKADYGTQAQIERDMLQQENKKYKEVIDKAIEFIYAHSSMEPPYYEFREFYNASNLSELLDILKEVE